MDKPFIDIDDYTIPTGQDAHIFMRGNFFMLLESSADVDIDIVLNNTVIGKARSVTQGASFGPYRDDNGRPVRFDGVRIRDSGGGTQTVKVAISDGAADLRSVVGNVGIIAGANEMGYLRPRTLQSSYHASIGASQNTIVTPAANVNGVRIDLIAATNSAGTASMSLQSHTSAPASWLDVSTRLLWSHFYGAGIDGGRCKVPLPIIVPAGEGLYIQGSGVSAGNFSMSYEVL